MERFEEAADGTGGWFVNTNSSIIYDEEKMNTSCGKA